MAKKTLQAGILGKATEVAKSQKVDLNATVLVSPERLRPREKRTAAQNVYLTPSEKEKFLSMIGRESFSDAVRNLILAHIRNG